MLRQYWAHVKSSQMRNETPLQVSSLNSFMLEEESYFYFSEAKLVNVS